MVFPIIAAGLGTLASVNSIVQQNRSAAAQREALDASARAADRETQIRLAEIESQKLYLNQLLTLQNLARAQEQGLAIHQNTLQENALDQAITQEGLNQQANALLTQRGFEFANQELLNRRFGQQQQLQQQEILRQNQRNLNFFGENAQLQLSNASQLGGLASQLRDRINLIENQKVGVQEQILGQLQDIAQEYQNATEQERQNLRNQAAAAVSLSTRTGGLSASDQALLAEQDNRLIHSALDRAFKAGRIPELLDQAQQFQLQQLDDQANRARTDFRRNRELLSQNVATRRTTLLGNKNLEDTADNLQLNLQGLSEDQLGELQRAGINLETLTELNLNDIGTQERLLQLGVDRRGLEALKVVQANTFSLANAADRLNREFGNLALTAQGIGIQASGAAQRESLMAARAGVTSPGLLGFLAAGASGAGTIAGILSRRNPTGTTNRFPAGQNPFPPTITVPTVPAPAPIGDFPVPGSTGGTFPPGQTAFTGNSFLA